MGSSCDELLSSPPEELLSLPDEWLSLDEFTADILQVMVNPATQQTLKEKIGKESSIFAEIIYGKKREDSAGLRIIKRKNSELLTTSLMIDNKIINAYKLDNNKLLTVLSDMINFIIHEK